MLRRRLNRLRTLATRNRVDDEIKRELEFHVHMEADKRQRAGMTPDEARRTALRDFGAVSSVREDVRDVRGMTFWDTLSQDVRYGVRTLRRSPGYAAAAILVLGLGIGANTAMFSVINGVFLRPLPFSNGDELVLVQQSASVSNVPDAGVGIPELWAYRKRLQSVRDLVEFHGMNFTLLNQGEPDRIDAGVVSANFFSMLGVNPLHGRTFIDTDDDLGAPAVLVLSHAYWQSKFGGDPAVVGRVLEMNNRPHTVVGVLPAFPQYPRDNDVYMPTSACPFRAGAEADIQGSGGMRAFPALRVFGRLTEGATVDSAAAEIATVSSTFERDAPDDYKNSQSVGITGKAASLQETLVANARFLVFAISAATMLVLLIACANVANLALARTMQRGRELALRTALGAGRRRLMRQLLTESLLVAVAGGVVGLGLAWLSLDLLADFVGRFTPRTTQIALDVNVLGFALGTSLLTGLVFGVAPALATRRNPVTAMRAGGAQSGDSAARTRARSGLVVAQVGVSFALIVGAALMLESFYRFAAKPLGYDTDRVLTAAIFGNFSRNSGPEATQRLYANVLERLRTSPGIKAAAITNTVPQSNITPFPLPIRIEGRTFEGTRRVEADRNITSDGYFDALGIPLLAGRDVRPSDTLKSPRVAVINASMAAFWDGADPLGSRFAAQGPGPVGAAPAQWITVVGVVPDFRLYPADRQIPAEYYTPVTQTQGIGARLLVRTEGDPREMVQTMKAAVHAVDPQVPVDEVKTLSDLRGERLASPGLTTALVSMFAAVALIITLAGLGGVIGTSVSQRTREFGLRLALGASPGSVLWMVLRQGVTLVAIGLALGLAGAYMFSRVIARFLFETTPTDVAAYAAVALVFLVAAAIACAAPARRATSIDPLTALKTD